MSLIPSHAERTARALSDLRMGVPIILGDLLVVAAETVSKDRFSALMAQFSLQLAITQWRAQTLKARFYDQGFARIAVPGDATLAWVQAIADPADDLLTPMKGPFHPVRDDKGGDVAPALELLKSARILPAALIGFVEEGADYAQSHGFTHLNPAQLARELSENVPLHAVVSARVPLSVSEAGRLHVFRPDNGGEEHYVVEIGTPSRDAPVLTRLHSACFTGDLLGSLKCDCGPQLKAALAQMGAEGSGVLLYLNQEGRGIGLANKMRAYSLQDQGFDTVEANHRLGFEDDERDFRLGASLLGEMGFKKIRLMTNNPAKVSMLEQNGLEVVERVPLIVGRTEQNEDYLRVKARKSGHLL